MRKSFLAGNWKMNLERESARALVGALADRVAGNDDVEVAVFPPFVYAAEIAEQLKASSIRVGAQNCCVETSGAFTGEVSAVMLRDIGCELVILGHSERRHVYGEDDELIGRKVRTALDAGLDVILCVGETLEEREAGTTERVVARQMEAGLKEVAEAEMTCLVVAYEPVWAIGTGLTATPQQAGEVHTYLRGLVSGLFGQAVADDLRIQYGGSVKPDNVKELMAVADIDGALVGGASLKAEAFLPIVEYDR